LDAKQSSEDDLIVRRKSRGDYNPNFYPTSILRISAVAGRSSRD
jgi:hypothetical protein